MQTDKSMTCTCEPQNRAPYPATCGRCGGEVVPGCACRADVRRYGRDVAVVEGGPAAARWARTRVGHRMRDPQGPGACEALVPAFGQVCDYCEKICSVVGSKLYAVVAKKTRRRARVCRHPEYRRGPSGPGNREPKFLCIVCGAEESCW